MKKGRTVLVLTLVLFVGGVAAQDQEHNQLLKGVYGFTENLVCVQPVANEEGAFPDLPHVVEVSPGILQLQVDAETSSVRALGIAVFDGSGGMQQTTNSLAIYHGRGAAGSFPVEPQPTSDCEGTYSVDSDRNVTLSSPFCTQEIPGDIPLTMTFGPFD